MSALDELERELGPRLRSTLDEMLAGPDVALDDDERRPRSPISSGAAISELPRPPKRRAWVTAAAAVIALVGLVAIAVARPSEPTAPADSGPTTPADSTVVPPTTELSWVEAENLGSLGRSSVTGIVAGPTGFVATGMGFDDQRNQGRVWFSPDGATWDEPAFEMFDTLEVSPPVATSRAFYVAAATNTDRTPESEGEGQSTLSDAHMYRSVDGVVWELWGESLGDVPLGVFGFPGGLLRTDNPVDPADRTPWWSTDGLGWSRAEFENPDSSSGIGGPLGGATVGDRYYAIGFRYPSERAEFSVWESSDGLRWELLPAPPLSGQIIEASGSLLIISWDAIGVEPIVAHRFDVTSQQWEPLPSDAASTLLSDASLVEIGDLLVAVIAGERSPMTVWTSPADEIAWQPDPTARLEADQQRASPPPTAASGDRVVIVWPTMGVGGTTVVQIGTLT